ncbi:DUF4292 domain-containing protein [Bacteroidales bacterium OttesenSCG-928-K03]|nr:DUF4292 domain-containing protein [Odoribacter sp. OttesenSCG-928-L07]MDL2239430.1 DUF4292 domain-containing protein [Bacteroidales bacterium OttesenSCG-928-L14]MDL2241104.1 DUF4292 domain-containing protein [Bacteroidales bacterium OttesenSCG-928-K22]MDL2242219.1 DUF4292 domain-containing protein [Bacteroidales bacterium OttesenSCG-928-K03]
MNKRILTVICLIIACISFSCSHTRKISSIKTEIPTQLSKLELSDLNDSIEKYNIKPENLNCRFEAEIIDKAKNKSDNLKGTLSFNSDSMMLQITSKAINIASALITNDSILILNKLGKSYISDALSNYDFLKREITFDDIKNILLGMRIDFPNNEVFSYSVEKYYSLNYRNSSRIFYNINFNNDFKVEKMQIFSEISLFYVISYFNFLNVENIILPTEIELNTEDMYCKIKLSRFNFEKKNNLNIKIPNNYIKVDTF